MNSEDFIIDTKYASIKTKLQAKDIGIILLIIIFAIGIPIYKSVGLDFVYTLLLLVLTFFLTLYFLSTIVYQKDPMSNLLDSVYDLEHEMAHLKDTMTMDESVKTMILEARLRNYETCYFRSFIFGTPSLQNALKDKVDELKQEIQMRRL